MQHGWLLPELIRLDDCYQGRYEQWRYMLQTGEVLPDIPHTQFLSPGDKAFEQCLAMLNGCLEAIARPGALHTYKAVQYLASWLLYAFGYPFSETPHPEPEKGASQRLKKAFDLDLVLRCPADYFGALLAAVQYGQNWRGKQSPLQFYPTLQPVAQMMAEVSNTTMQLESFLPGPYHIIEYGIGTGRIALEFSNIGRSLLGWELDPLLMQCAAVNFLLYAPDFALPLPHLAGDLILGNCLSGKGVSWVRGTPVAIAYPRLPAPTHVRAPTVKPTVQPEIIIVEGTKYEQTKSGTLQGTFF